MASRPARLLDAARLVPVYQCPRLGRCFSSTATASNDASNPPHNNAPKPQRPNSRVYPAGSPFSGSLSPHLARPPTFVWTRTRGRKKKRVQETFIGETTGDGKETGDVIAQPGQATGDAVSPQSGQATGDGKGIDNFEAKFANASSQPRQPQRKVLNRIGRIDHYVLNTPGTFNRHKKENTAPNTPPTYTSNRISPTSPIFSQSVPPKSTAWGLTNEELAVPPEPIQLTPQMFEKWAGVTKERRTIFTTLGRTTTVFQIDNPPRPQGETYQPVVPRYVAVIDNFRALETCLVDLALSRTWYVSLSGVNLSRKGTLDLVSIVTRNNTMVYVIDVFTLGDRAFTWKPPGIEDPNFCLKGMLGRPEYQKRFWDVRCPANALDGLVGIKLGGILDLQYLEAAVRPYTPHNDKVHPQSTMVLATAVRCIGSLTPRSLMEWHTIKRVGGDTAGIHPNTWQIRPLPKPAMMYAANEVRFLPQIDYKLRLVADTKVGLLEDIHKASNDRVKHATSSTWERGTREERREKNPWANGVGKWHDKPSKENKQR